MKRIVIHKVLLFSALSLLCFNLSVQYSIADGVISKNETDCQKESKIEFRQNLIVNPVERLFQSDGTVQVIERNLSIDRERKLILNQALQIDIGSDEKLEPGEKRRPYLHYVVPILITLAAGTSTYLLFSIRSH